MPKYIVETNFFIEADSEQAAQVKVETELALAKYRRHTIPRFTVAWVSEEDEE